MYIRNLRKPSPNKNIYKFSSLKNRDAITEIVIGSFIYLDFLQKAH